MLKAAAVVAATSYIAWYFQEHELKAVYPFDATYATPASAGVPMMTEEQFETADGEILVVWRAEALGDKPTIFYYSGNAGGLKERSQRFRKFIDEGYGVVAPAYRGSSGSTGMPEQEVLLADARALVAAESSSQIVLYGESLGTAVAIRLASEGIGTRIVLEAPFTSIPDLILSQHPSEDIDHLITQRWESDRFIGAVTQPLMIVHGERDHLVPFAMGEEMFHAAGSKTKVFLGIEARRRRFLVTQWCKLVPACPPGIECRRRRPWALDSSQRCPGPGGGDR